MTPEPRMSDDEFRQFVQRTLRAHHVWHEDHERAWQL